MNRTRYMELLRGEIRREAESIAERFSQKAHGFNYDQIERKMRKLSATYEEFKAESAAAMKAVLEEEDRRKLGL